MKRKERGDVSTSGGGRLVIGVDGGGTKTEAVLAVLGGEGSPREIARCASGPSNLQSGSQDSIRGEIRSVFERLFADRPEMRPQVGAVCFCMAGAGNELLRHRFEEWARSEWATPGQIAPRILVTHDARCLLAAGTQAGSGVALIAGTGSLAYARGAAGNESRCGGWGSLFGDEGSAYWLALAAFRAASQAVDGRGPPTGLVAALTEWIGGGRPEDWLAELRRMEPAAVASAARIVSQLADAEDAVSRQLIEQAAEQLARMLVTLARRCFFDQPIDLALAGGLLLCNEGLRTSVLRQVGEAGVAIADCQQVVHPVVGAVKLAAEAARSGHPTLD